MVIYPASPSTRSILRPALAISCPPRKGLKLWLSNFNQWILMVSVKPHIFRAYDIRGVYGVDLDEEVAELVGLAYGTLLGNRGRIVLGRDVR
ncbi:MAG: hypothetical protein QXO04_03970, partial [Nitrososphaerota archaeon]